MGKRLVFGEELSESLKGGEVDGWIVVDGWRFGWGLVLWFVVNVMRSGLGGWKGWGMGIVKGLGGGLE